MLKVKPLLAVVLKLFAFLNINALQAQEFAQEVVLDPAIQTILLFKQGNPLSYPVIDLNGNEKLEAHFDCLGNEPRIFNYKIIHCDRNWNKSDINYFDFASGLDFIFINDYELSRTRYSRYTHYKFFFPNDDIGLKIPGNYILVVRDDETQEIVFTKKFFVIDYECDIEARTFYSRDVDRYNEDQEIDFKVIANKFIANKQAFLTTTEAMICQNLSFNSNYMYLKPRFIQSEQLDFNYEGEKNFRAGNEFINLDLTNLNATNDKIGRFGIEKDTINVLLTPDFPRYDNPYLFIPDINGRTFIRVNDPIFNQTLDAEYVKVYFYYKSENLAEPLYLYGGFTNNLLDHNMEMTYVQRDKLYYKTVWLKQGYYNYKLVTETEGLPDESNTMGNKRQTENEYAIFVYYKRPNEFFDRLIGFKVVKFPQE